jgi:hypothetical protein
MADRKEPKKTVKREKKAKAPRNPDVGYITHKVDGSIATGRTVEVYDYLTGSSIKEIDQPRAALRPGRRVSRNGNVYYEFRANRADINPMEGL